ncbi:sensor histidine kinase N-terminal domain-containing protein, partial [Ramlibacter sp.]|uniref:sensor histidine kinase N-terminal domain-containing protein n=1 Tax=Ramlibacter sp. TaxID=1917967 RepID=UPI0017CC0E7D
MKGPSLTRHLLAWTLGALVLVWGSLVAVGYMTGQHEADELTDGHLASTSALLLAYESGTFTPGTVIGPPAGAAQLKAHDYQQSLSVVIWDAQGRVLTRMGDAPEPDFSTPQGFATLQLGVPPAAWRVFSRWNEGRTRKIMVLLSAQERHDLAEDIAEQISQPGLWLLPVVALLLGLAVWRGLRPLYRLSQEVLALDIQRPRPLAQPARHAELAAIADAIGLLVQRYNAALTRERALADEFAHELRTPLA